MQCFTSDTIQVAHRKWFAALNIDKVLNYDGPGHSDMPLKYMHVFCGKAAIKVLPPSEKGIYSKQKKKTNIGLGSKCFSLRVVYFLLDI